jgi:hypothetical protein
VKVTPAPRKVDWTAADGTRGFRGYFQDQRQRGQPTKLRGPSGRVKMVAESGAPWGSIDRTGQEMLVSVTFEHTAVSAACVSLMLLEM